MFWVAIAYGLLHATEIANGLQRVQAILFLTTFSISSSTPTILDFVSEDSRLDGGLLSCRHREAEVVELMVDGRVVGGLAIVDCLEKKNKIRIVRMNFKNLCV